MWPSGVRVSRGRLGHTITVRVRERLAYEDDRRDFDEWISPIRLPKAAVDRPRAEATTLGALMDFAIDTDNSVVDDPDDSAYYVGHDGYLYTYHPPRVDAEPTGESAPTGNSSADADADHDDTSSGGRVRCR